MPKPTTSARIGAGEEPPPHPAEAVSATTDPQHPSITAEAPEDRPASSIYGDMLASRILLVPEGMDSLNVVSGYASPTALLWCLSEHLQTAGPRTTSSSFQPKVRLVIGMAGTGAVTQDQHTGYQELCRRFPGVLEIRYTARTRLIHSKVYVWTSQGSPGHAFLGSANFTHQGMNIGQQHQENVMCRVDAAQAMAYFDKCWAQSITCLHPHIEELVPISAPAERKTPEEPPKEPQEEEASTTLGGEDSHDFYLYSHRKMKPYGPSGGINWGVAKGNRKRNGVDEAYFAVPPRIVEKEFFPPPNMEFTVHCDDGEILTMRLASGKRGKDITTLPHNYLLGQYIRGRMGVPSGQLVGIAEILRYGRGHVTITKVAETEYMLDFSPPDPQAALDADLVKLFDRNR